MLKRDEQTNEVLVTNEKRNYWGVERMAIKEKVMNENIEEKVIKEKWREHKVREKKRGEGMIR